MELLHSEITEKILGAFYEVYNTLGYGFLEKVYEKALYIELQKTGLKVEVQKKINVYYNGCVIGSYFADLFVQELVIIELKAAECIMPEHECQLINYLKATGVEVGLLLNFGKRAHFKRKVFTRLINQR